MFSIQLPIVLSIVLPIELPIVLPIALPIVLPFVLPIGYSFWPLCQTKPKGTQLPIVRPIARKLQLCRKLGLCEQLILARRLGRVGSESTVAE